MPISLDQASTAIGAAFAKGADLKLRPLTVAVPDAGGHLTALQRQDASSTLRPQIACGMAGGALGVTGDTSDNDELCALAGIAAAGLRAQH